MRNIYPDCDMNRWSVTDNCGEILANADNYYTKKQIDDKIDEIDSLTPEEAQSMIDKSISGKADISVVNELAQKVTENTNAILNRYTKEETNNLLNNYLTKLKANEMFANYSKVENTTLILNNENITI